MAFRSSIATQSRSQIMPGGISTTLRTNTGERWGMLSGHIPHHSTIAEVEAILHQWGKSPALSLPKALLGLDANEQFLQTTPDGTTQAHTGRGETLLNWGSTLGLRLPPQALQSPTYTSPTTHCTKQGAWTISSSNKATA